MPHRDLYVSPDHAIYIDGRLIRARQLVNGTTIHAVQGLDAVEYFHVELDTHGILLAEGLTAESYIDAGNRGLFADGDEPVQLYPDLLDDGDSAAGVYCAPFVRDDAEAQSLWQRMADRAAGLGMPAALTVAETTAAAEPLLVVGGKSIRPTIGHGDHYMFVLPPGTEEVRLVSRAAVPADIVPWGGDRRRLGLYVERIRLRHGSTVSDIALDHPGLAQGWWDIEGEGDSTRRWTDGDAVLAVPALAGVTLLEIQARGLSAYPAEAAAAA